jgi:hypothetical protein
MEVHFMKCAALKERAGVAQHFRIAGSAGRQIAFRERRRAPAWIYEPEIEQQPNATRHLFPDCVCSLAAAAGSYVLKADVQAVQPSLLPRHFLPGWGPLVTEDDGHPVMPSLSAAFSRR